MPDKAQDPTNNTRPAFEDNDVIAASEASPPAPKASKKQPREYTHVTCGTTMTMSDEVAADYYADPTKYESLFCTTCNAGVRIGEDGEVVWANSNNKVGADG